MKFPRVNLACLSFSLLYFIGNVALGSATQINALPERHPLQSWSPASSSLLTLMGSISSSRVAIKRIFDPKSAIEPPVVLIEDVHLNKEAQTQIAATLQTLIDGDQVGMVGVEGAFETFHFERFRAFPDKTVNRRVAQAFLDAAKIAAPTFVGISSAKAVPLVVGIDDRSHYRSNVEAYLTALPSQKAVQKEIEARRARLEIQKVAVFTGRLLEFDRARSRFRQGNGSLLSYVRLLGQWTVSLPGNMVHFLKAAELEDHLDFQKAQAERDQLFSRLLRVVSPGQRRDLLSKSMAFKNGAISYAAYYQNLEDMARRHGLDNGNLVHLRAYIAYVNSVDAVSAASFWESLEKMEASAARLASSKLEKNLLAIDDDLFLLQKLADFSLTSRQWSAYQEGSATRSQRFHQAGLTLDFARLRPFERFYLEADIRSDLMVQSLMRKRDRRPSVFVVGGFHTEKIENQFRVRGVPYLVLTPRLTQVTRASGPASLTVFQQEKMPLDRFFEGKKLFINPDRVAAVATNEPKAGLTGASILALQVVLTREKQRQSAFTPDTGVLKVHDESNDTVVTLAGQNLQTPAVDVEVHETDAHVPVDTGSTGVSMGSRSFSFKIEDRNLAVPALLSVLLLLPLPIQLFAQSGGAFAALVAQVMPNLSPYRPLVMLGVLFLGFLFTCIFSSKRQETMLDENPSADKVIEFFPSRPSHLFTIVLAFLPIAFCIAFTHFGYDMNVSRYEAGLYGAVVGTILQLVGRGIQARFVKPLGHRFVLDVMVSIPLWATIFGDYFHGNLGSIRWIAGALLGASVPALMWFLSSKLGSRYGRIFPKTFWPYDEGAIAAKQIKIAPHFTRFLLLSLIAMDWLIKIIFVLNTDHGIIWHLTTISSTTMLLCLSTVFIILIMSYWFYIPIGFTLLTAGYAANTFEAFFHGVNIDPLRFFDGNPCPGDFFLWIGWVFVFFHLSGAALRLWRLNRQAGPRRKVSNSLNSHWHEFMSGPLAKLFRLELIAPKRVRYRLVNIGIWGMLFSLLFYFTYRDSLHAQKFMASGSVTDDRLAENEKDNAALRKEIEPVLKNFKSRWPNVILDIHEDTYTLGLLVLLADLEQALTKTNIQVPNTIQIYISKNPEPMVRYVDGVAVDYARQSRVEALTEALMLVPEIGSANGRISSDQLQTLRTTFEGWGRPIPVRALSASDNEFLSTQANLAIQQLMALSGILSDHWQHRKTVSTQDERDKAHNLILTYAELSKQYDALEALNSIGVAGNEEEIRKIFETIKRICTDNNLSARPTSPNGSLNTRPMKLGVNDRNNRLVTPRVLRVGTSHQINPRQSRLTRSGA